MNRTIQEILKEDFEKMERQRVYFYKNKRYI